MGGDKPIIQVIGDFHVISYQSGGTPSARAFSLTIPVSGFLISAAVGSVHISPNPGSFHNALLKIGESAVEGVFAASFHDATNNAVSTYAVSPAGVIKFRDNITFPGFGPRPELINVSGDVYALAEQEGAGIVIRTFTIDSTGIIGPLIDLFNLDPSLRFYVDIENLGSGLFVVAFETLDQVGILKIVDIKSSGLCRTPR